MLDPSVDGDVIDFDATLDEQFFDITEGESVSEIPADGEHDDLGRDLGRDLGLAYGVAERVGGIVVDELVISDQRRAECRLRVRLETESRNNAD